jgi:hypothetical protein
MVPQTSLLQIIIIPPLVTCSIRAPTFLPLIFNLTIDAVHPIDPSAMNDRASFTARMACCRTFRQHIINRDNSCTITREAVYNCDAAHLIPFSKGDMVLWSFRRLCCDTHSLVVLRLADTRSKWSVQRGCSRPTLDQ